MFAFSNVLHLFTDELSRLCGRRLSFARVAPRTLECLSFRHSDPPTESCINRSRSGITPVGRRAVTGDDRKRTEDPVARYRQLISLT